MKPVQFCINLIYRSATGGPRLRRLLTPLAGGVFLSLVALVVLAALRLDSYLGLPAELIPYPWSFFVSGLLLVPGLLLMAWSVAHFIAVRGTPVPFNPPPRLVCSGPYARVRNPMLSGLFLFGLGLFFHSLSLIFIFTPLFILVNYLELKKIEEPELEKRLGRDYLEYKRKVPMFFPRPRRERKALQQESQNRRRIKPPGG